MKNIKPIRTKADYKAAMERIEELIALNPKKEQRRMTNLM
jgi:antitoxin component HigA of HigAB toxin-antitoxin module